MAFPPSRPRPPRRPSSPSWACPAPAAPAADTTAPPLQGIDRPRGTSGNTDLTTFSFGEKLEYLKASGASAAGQDGCTGRPTASNRPTSTWCSCSRPTRSPSGGRGFYWAQSAFRHPLHKCPCWSHNSKVPAYPSCF